MAVAGIAAVTAAALLFGVVAALVKSANAPPLVLLQCRSFVQLALSLVAVHRCSADSADSADEHGSVGDRDDWRWLEGWLGPQRLWYHLALRALLHWGFLCLWWLALTSMPVGDATCVVYLGPLFSAGFAKRWLDEQPPPVFPLCACLSMTGVVLVTQGGQGRGQGGEDGGGGGAGWHYSMGVAAALCSAAIAGVLPVLTRKSREAHWATVELWSAATSTFVFTPLALLAWVNTDTDTNTAAAAAAGGHHSRAGEVRAAVAGILQFRHLFAIVAAISLVGFAGLGLQTFGYQREEAARASMMTFLEVPFAYVLQWRLFGQVPTVTQACGMGLIVASCVVNVRNKLHGTARAGDSAASSTV